jgi:hypothetical protein
VKPRSVALNDFKKQIGRDKNLDVNERIKNVLLDNTKKRREAEMKEAKELKRMSPFF